LPDGRRYDERMDMSVYTQGAPKRKNDDVV
jgi:hypothetical protein